MTAYRKDYLTTAMNNMGEMMEYAERGCGMDPEKFLALFSYSSIGVEWSTGNPVYICGRSGSELCTDVLQKAGYTAFQERPIGVLDLGETFWCGWILAYYQWRSADMFQDIYQIVTFQVLQKIYPAGHTASEERACELIDTVRFGQSSRAATRLQLYRRKIGLSQSELARMSEVNLRTLQEYEVGRKSLAQASAQKVIRLAEILQVTPAELISQEL